MSDYLPSGIKIPNHKFFLKKRKMIITIYGPYGDFKSTLKEIASIIRKKYGYQNCKLVSQRKYLTLEEDEEIRIRDKSYHFLESSHVLIFIFFCDKKDKSQISHAESPAGEITHLLAVLQNKLKCCLVLREDGCMMGPVPFGDVKKLSRNFPILYEKIVFESNEEIANIIQAKCLTFLQNKYREIS